MTAILLHFIAHTADCVSGDALQFSPELLELCFQPGKPGHELGLDATAHIPCGTADTALASLDRGGKTADHRIHPVAQRIYRGREVITHGTGKPLHGFHY